MLDFDPSQVEPRFHGYLDLNRFEVKPQFDLHDPRLLGLMEFLQAGVEAGCPGGSLFGDMIGKR